MVRKNKIQEQVLRDILLKMNYDSSKTLNENITEQGGVDIKQDLYLKNKEPRKEPDTSKDYPNYCRYPDKAVNPNEIKDDESSIGATVDGKDLLIPGYCFYPVSSNETPGKKLGMWIPSTTEINFTDIADISEYVNLKINSKLSSSFWSGFTDEQIQFIVTTNMVIGTVQSFNDGNNGKVVSYFSKPNNSFNVNEVKIKGLFYKDSGKAYVQPKWEDRRTDWDKIVDRWGTAVQIGVAVVAVAASVATGGLGGMALLAAEIALEGTIGAIMAQREWEKGNKAGAGFELIFGLTPWLKGLKGIRSLKPGVVKSLTSKMGKAGLNAESSVDDVVTFYRGLGEAEKDAFTRFIKDTSDELSEATLKTALGKALTENMYAYAKKSPEIFKDLGWYQKVWAKEGFVNGGILLTNLAYTAYFGKELTEIERLELEGIFLQMPEETGKDILKQVVAKPEMIEKLVEYAPEVKERVSKRIDMSSMEIYAEFNKNGLLPVNNPKVDDVSSIPDGYEIITWEKWDYLMDQIDSGVIDEKSVKEMTDDNGARIYLSKMNEPSKEKN